MTMKKPIQTYTNKKGEVLEIFVDENIDSPREWFDNVGKIYAEHRRYTIGDKDATREEAEKALVCLNLYMFEHSGIALSTRPFNDRWDSGQIGYVYATREAIQKTYGVKRITKKLIQTVKKDLAAEVETYSQYLNGEVYGYVKSKLSICDHNEQHKEEIHSCWGYYGDSIKEIITNEWVYRA